MSVIRGKSIIVGKTDLAWGVVDKPFVPPEGCRRFRVRMRNDSFAMATCVLESMTTRRPLIDCGDHLELAGPELEQGRNTRG